MLRRISMLVLAMTTLLAISPVLADIDLTEIVKKIQPSVATIITYDEDEKILGQGTGFFIDQKGHLISNYHVFKGAHSAEVRTFDEKIYSVKKVIAINEDTDLIKVSVDIPTKDLKFVKTAHDVPQVAERVLVVGSPLGLEQTVTEGIISAVREIPSIGKILQLSAAISSGSSGSPVVNMKGEVVGIATFQLVEGQSLNFAVSAENILTLKSMTKAQTLSEWSLDLSPVKVKTEPIVDSKVGKIEIPEDVRIAYAEYEAAKRKVEEIESSLNQTLKTYQPTSRIVVDLKEKLNHKRANQIKPAKVLDQLLTSQIQAKQNLYEEITKELLPSTSQAKDIQRDIRFLRKLQIELKILLGGNPGDIVTNSIGMRLVWIPAGEFVMGSPPAEIARQYLEPLPMYWSRQENESPVHHVTISSGFWIGQTEVTQAQYMTIMGTNPSYYKGDDLPVESVSWHDAVEFCKKLSQEENLSYQLPTEAQWEYACRAGTKTRFSFGDDESLLSDYAWYYDNSSDTTHPVGKKKPNEIGLYDMHGNVYEWCNDRHGKYTDTSLVDPQGASSGSERVYRGGSYTDLLYDFALMNCRSAARKWISSDFRFNQIGFRVVLVDSQ